MAEGEIVLVSQILPVGVRETFQPIGEADLLRRTVTEGGERDVHVPHPPGKDDAVPVLRPENVLDQTGAGSGEPGEEDGGRSRIDPDAARNERDESVGGPHVDPAVPGNGPGVGGERARVDAVVGPEDFPSPLGEDVPDDGGAGGEPELIPVRGKSLDFHPVQERLRLLFRKGGQSLAGPGKDAGGGGKETVDIVGGKGAVLCPERRPAALGTAAEDAAAGRGEPQGAIPAGLDVDDPVSRIPLQDEPVRPRVIPADSRVGPGPEGPVRSGAQGIDAGGVQAVGLPVFPDPAGFEVEPEQVVGIGPHPEIVSLAEQGVDVQSGEPVRPFRGLAPSAGLVPQRIVPEKTAVVGPNPEGSVFRVFAKATDDVFLLRPGEVRKGHRLELADIGRHVINSAIIGSDPEAALMVPCDGIDELVRQGGRVLPVVPVEVLFSGLGRHFQQAVVRSHQEIPGTVMRQGMDVVEPFSGRDGQVDRPGGKVRPVESAFPGPHPEISVPVFVQGADPGRRTILEGKPRGNEGLAGRMENEHSFFGGHVGHPDPAVFADQDGFRLVAVQPVFRLPVQEAEYALSPGGDPDAPVPVFGKARDLGVFQERLLGQIVSDVPVQAVVRPYPEDPGGVFHQGQDGGCYAAGKRMVDDFPAVIAVQAVPVAQPDQAHVVLDDGPHRVRGKPVPGCDVAEYIIGGSCGP